MNDKRQPGWRVGRDLTMTATSQEKPPNHISTNWFRWTITHREDIKLTMLEDEVVEHFSLSLFHSFTHSLSHTLSFFCLWMMTPPREGGRFRWRWMREEGRGGFSFIYSSITISNQFFASTFCVWNRDLNTSSPSLPILFLCLKRITVYSNLRIVVFRFPPVLLSLFLLGEREKGGRGGGEGRVLLLNGFFVFSASSLLFPSQRKNCMNREILPVIPETFSGVDKGVRFIFLFWQIHPYGTDCPTG